MRALVLTLSLPLIMAAGIAAGDAAAQTPRSQFLEKVGEWTVLSLPLSCIAINRDPAAFNNAPFDALQFAQRNGTAGVRLTVFFQPNAIARPGPAAMALELDGGRRLDLPGVSDVGYRLDTERPLSVQEIGALVLARQLTAFTPDGKGAVRFAVGGLADMLAALGRCASRA